MLSPRGVADDSYRVLQFRYPPKLKGLGALPKRRVVGGEQGEVTLMPDCNYTSGVLVGVTMLADRDVALIRDAVGVCEDPVARYDET